MDQHFFQKRYEINSFLVNTQKKLGLYSLLNLLQDTAWAHATRMGFGYEESIKKKVFWVLSRQKLVMNQWPGWSDEIEIRTWIRPFQKSFVYRDFEIFSADRQKLGECTTSWVLLDAETRKPTTIDFESMKEITRSEGNLELETEKIELRADLKTRAQYQVRNSDLDLNQHVNNTKYAQWILDSIPQGWHEQFILHSYEVNFLAETRSEDRVLIQSSSESEGPRRCDWVQFQGLKEADQKTLFAARLQVSSK
jgi:acyl-ACP thioesterase